MGRRLWLWYLRDEVKYIGQKGKQKWIKETLNVVNKLFLIECVHSTSISLLSNVELYISEQLFEWSVCAEFFSFVLLQEQFFKKIESLNCKRPNYEESLDEIRDANLC